MSLRNKLSAMRAMSGAERRFVAEAVIFLAISRLLIVLMPVRRLGPLLASGPRHSAHDADRTLHWNIRRAVMRAARHVPWNAVCLPQAMAAKFMLGRRGCASTLHLGVGRTATGDLAGHAWLEVGGAIVLGEGGMESVTPVAQFGWAEPRV